MATDPNLTPTPDALDSPDFVDDTAADTIATPEGDNEYAPDQPLTGDNLTITRPRGDEPHSEEPLHSTTE
jgi:hypothetical protein